MRKKKNRKRKPRRRRGIDAHDPNIIRIDAVLENEADDAPLWVHTHGLEAFGLPELEIRGVAPRFLASTAAHMLRDIADYLLNSGRRVHLDDAMLVDDGTAFQFSAAEPRADCLDHYVPDRWTVSDLPGTPCALCAASEEADEEEPVDDALPSELVN